MSSKRAQRRKQERKQCEGKKRYFTKLMAQIRNRKRRDDAFPYKCKFCGYWHLGHNEQLRQEIYEKKDNK